MAARLAGALASLSEGDRDVLLLTSWAGLDAGEVAEALGIPAGTVRSRLHRVRKWLRANAPGHIEPRRRPRMPDENVREMWSDDELDAALAALRSDVDTDPARLAGARRELVGAEAGSAPPVPAAKRWRRWVASAAAVGGRRVRRAGRADRGVREGRARRPEGGRGGELDSAADRIASGDETVGPGQYLYVGSHDWTMATAADPVPAKSISWLEEDLVEKWVPADDRQEWLIRQRTDREASLRVGHRGRGAAGRHTDRRAGAVVGTRAVRACPPSGCVRG